MSTTALLVEHLIAGVQALAWFVPLCLALCGGLGRLDLASLKDFATPLAVAALAVAYPLGLVADESADRLLRRSSERIRRRVFKPAGLNSESRANSVMDLLAGDANEFQVKYFTSGRMKIRILRSTALNAAAVASMAAVLWILREPFFLWAPARMPWAVCPVALGVAAAALWGWYSVSMTFEERLAGRLAARAAKRDGGVAGAAASRPRIQTP
jgi:hypothetical protein